MKTGAPGPLQRRVGRRGMGVHLLSPVRGGIFVATMFIQLPQPRRGGITRTMPLLRSLGIQFGGASTKMPRRRRCDPELQRPGASAFARRYGLGRNECNRDTPNCGQPLEVRQLGGFCFNSLGQSIRILYQVCKQQKTIIEILSGDIIPPISEGEAQRALK